MCSLELLTGEKAKSQAVACTSSTTSPCFPWLVHCLDIGTSLVNGKVEKQNVQVCTWTCSARSSGVLLAIGSSGVLLTKVHR